MTSTKKCFLSVMVLACLVATTFCYAAHVPGYTRKDGTYVAPYERKSPSHSGSYSSPKRSYARRTRTSNFSGSTSHTAHYATGYLGTRDEHGRIVRSESAKREFMKMTGYSHGKQGYVVDHIVPLKRGGADAPSNMQWQTVAEAKAKDKRE